MIEVRDLVKVFDTRGHVVRAVDHVTTQVAKGEVLVVIGPSGSGKSTFLRCLNGLEEFDSGSVSIDGLQLADPKTDVNAYRRERTGEALASVPDFFPRRSRPGRT
uniref:ATP-binding cassette domain-containing protein n=1 Tax=Pseudomonas sp. TaxID=306 RepID=UPI002587C3A7